MSRKVPPTPEVTRRNARSPCRQGFGDVGELALEDGGEREAADELHLGGGGGEGRFMRLRRAVDDKRCSRAVLHRGTRHLPNRAKDLPDRDRLAMGFERFRAPPLPSS
jgi:hypothetical protein